VASTLVLLVRHGTTPTTGKVLPGRARGLHLADAGRAQADAVAARIAQWATPPGPKVTAVYASPLERTRETAAPIAAVLGLKVTAERDCSSAISANGRAKSSKSWASFRSGPLCSAFRAASVSRVVNPSPGCSRA